MSAGFAPLKTRPVTLFGLPGFEDIPAILVQDYWIDRYEVTNRQFKEFLDKGGYRKPHYWKHEFRKDGRTLSWQAAMNMFRDSTGRPGPAVWAQGEYPRGQEDFPVSGVSWYEAAAYAEHRAKNGRPPASEEDRVTAKTVRHGAEHSKLGKSEAR
jgi:eukaryotic-like serine/threonine-protein kinase